MSRPLESRIRRLERTVKWQRGVVAVVFVALAAFVAMGQASEEPVPKVVKARSFQVVDADGAARGHLGPVGPDVFGLRIYDAAGKVTFSAPEVPAPDPRDTARHSAACLNNMKQICGLLLARQAAGQLKYYTGHAFVLQVAEEIRDRDLGVFLCPGAAYDGPEPGTPEFVARYRNLDLTAGDLTGLTSYAGPNWKDYPQARAGRAALKARVWICDACPDGKPHHAGGICVGYSTGKVTFVPIAKLTGHDPKVERILVGPDSPDEALKKMITDR